MARRSVVTSFAGALSYTPPHPERTGRRSVFNPRDPMAEDVEFREWPSRGALLETIAMQGRRERRRGDWRAVVPAD